MSLQSQSPRTAINRRYPMSNKRKKGLAPWMVLVGVAVIIGGLFWLFYPGDAPIANAANQEDADAAGDGSPATAGQTGRTGSDGTSDGRPDRRGSDGRNTDTGDNAPSALTAAKERKIEGEAKNQLEQGMKLLEDGDYVNGRAVLSNLLFLEGALPRNEAKGVRDALTNYNQRMIFTRSKRSSKEIIADPILTLYDVQSGDNLSKIGNLFRTPAKLIMRINGIKDARRLRADQSIQVLRGPVHAVVDKSDYRMDLYVVDPDGLPIYLKSYTVGLGEFDSTPVGKWRVEKGGKLGPDSNGGTGPGWTNPRTRKKYETDDPNIPIGEYWIGLEGIDEKTKKHNGYGIHATNEQDSIGRQESMGCIRMRDADVDEVFYTLYEVASTIEIVP